MNIHTHTVRHTHTHTHTHNGVLLSHKKDEILPFAKILMDYEGIMLSEISQTNTNTIWFHSYLEYIKTNKQTNKKTHRYRELIGHYQRGRTKWVKRVNCMVTHGNYTFSGDHTEVWYIQKSNYNFVHTKLT